jgi:hypothetical protein
MNVASLFALSLLSLGAAPLAAAQTVGQHPAVSATHALPGIDPNTFIVGHPASPRPRSGHANGQHPAITQWERSRTAAIDSNHFLVQPPAAVKWTLGPQAEVPELVPGTAAELASAAPQVRIRPN